MSQFVHKTGPDTMGTALSGLAPTGWFSSSCNVLGGQIGLGRLAAETAAICQPVRREDKQNPQGEGLNRVKNPLITLFLVYFCRFKRHIAPVYGAVT